MDDKDTITDGLTDLDGSISTTGATVHSDDFQIPGHQQEECSQDNVEENLAQKELKRDHWHDENSTTTAEIMIESDSQVPSFSSLGSTASTSPYGSFTTNLGDGDAEKPHRYIYSTEGPKKREEPVHNHKKLQTISRRRHREERRAAWERT